MRPRHIHLRIKAPEHFYWLGTYARYRPRGAATANRMVEIVAAAIAFARANQIGRLLVDLTRMTGLEVLNIWEQFSFATRLAQEARTAVSVAIVVRRSLIDPRLIRVLIARDRGFQIDVFDSERDALAWLQGPEAPWRAGA